jgi:hypothetical protein
MSGFVLSAHMQQLPLGSSIMSHDGAPYLESHICHTWPHTFGIGDNLSCRLSVPAELQVTRWATLRCWTFMARRSGSGTSSQCWDRCGFFSVFWQR